MYKADKAIIMAAGYGSRLSPVTDKCPKPLVKVNGVRMIATLIDALMKSNINDITIVRGYKKEQFDILKEDYPDIKFIDNDVYDKANNISSIVYAIDLLDNCYICEADLFISNPDIISAYHEHSDLLAFPVKQTDDWGFKVKNDVVYDYQHGIDKGFQFCGIAYLTSEDCKKLKHDILEVYNTYEGGKNVFWENVLLNIKKDNYAIHLKECKQDDIVEIDSYEELCDIDPSYKE